MQSNSDYNEKFFYLMVVQNRPKLLPGQKVPKAGFLHLEIIFKPIGILIQ